MLEKRVQQFMQVGEGQTIKERLEELTALRSEKDEQNRRQSLLQLA